MRKKESKMYIVERSEVEQRRTVCVTGHRPNRLGGYGLSVFNRLTVLAKKALDKYKPDVVYVGMAIGWDMAVARACHELDIPFVACVPFDGQESKWPERWRAWHRFLLSVASDVVIVSEGGFSKAAMTKRDQFMVDKSDTVVSLWSGDPSSGTGRCVQYATERGKTVRNLWQSWIKYK